MGELSKGVVTLYANNMLLSITIYKPNGAFMGNSSAAYQSAVISTDFVPQEMSGQKSQPEKANHTNIDSLLEV